MRSRQFMQRSHPVAGSHVASSTPWRSRLPSPSFRPASQFALSPNCRLSSFDLYSDSIATAASGVVLLGRI